MTQIVDKPYEKITQLLGALSPEELLQLRDEISTMVKLYASGGVLSGWGYFELKVAKRKRLVRDEEGKSVKDANGDPVYETVEYGPYLYLRRYILDSSGKRKLKSVGYYGKAGIAALELGLGKQLLEAHVKGGEEAGEDLIAEHVDEELPRRWHADKYPADRPQHPFNDDRITLTSLDENPLFKYLEKVNPVEAQDMVIKLRDYERDLRAWEYASRKRFTWRYPMREINQRRTNSIYKHGAHPPRMLITRIKQKNRDKPGSDKRRKK